MRTVVCDMLGIDVPIFAFTHCRDVVVAVSRAGGLGVLGTTRYSPEQLEIELSRIDEQLQGKPYGVDMLFPATSEGDDEDELRKRIPTPHRAFVDALRDRFHIPPPKTAAGQGHSEFGDNLINTHHRARQAFEVAISHPIRFLASALGPLPEDVAERAKAKGVKTAGLVGRPEHARKHVAAGADIIIAQSYEAGGHSGDIGGMVLWPQVVDAVAPIPVLAAGGIVSGRQIAAALTLGAAGVWMGSVWLPTWESELHPVVKEKLLRTTSRDTLRSRCLTGKPIRQLRTPWVEAWDAVDAPKPLPAPLQGLLVRDSMVGAFEHEVKEVMGTAVGQGISMVRESLTVRDVMYGMFEDFAETGERMTALYKADEA